MMMEKNQLDYKGQENFSIYHDLIIDAPLAKAFTAVSDPVHLAKWWPLKCEGKPEPGGEYNFYFSPDYDWFGRVLEYSVNESFHVKMTIADADWSPTAFGFDMNEVNGCCLLKFWQIGWPQCNAHFRRSSFCWAILLKGLKNYVEQGIVIPFTERE
jgi:uncharacterized protein YndB with AHSA1/START domain